MQQLFNTNTPEIYLPAKIAAGIKPKPDEKPFRPCSSVNEMLRGSGYVVRGGRLERE